ncbi:MAG: FecR family protein [Candidatus Omnitrophica bacterium]|nr:FecR family protein [Candidatus Omnitrophota bacterium]
MKRIGILILCAALAFPCSAMAMTAEIGKVTAAEGRVDVTRAPDNEAVLLSQGAPVFVGDSIRAKDHSKAEIVFADRSVVKIAPNTRMEIKDFAVKGSARVHAEIHIARGKIFADVSKTGSPDTFIITTPNAKGSVRGTEVIVFYQSERTGALVKDGRLSISNVSLPGQKKELTGGEAVMVSFDAAPEKPRPYMDAEFALHEQDTRPAIFREVSLGKGAGAMRGAITTLMGGVRILKKGGADWHYAKLNEFVEEGDKVETAEDGMTSLLFDNGNIVQIQPNSRIILSILKKDPKTGEFDNTFEVDSGKVKAVVEKLGKSSNFRVKTPTALCGVRGTIMYVNVAAGATQAFYEGGGGVVTNPVSGDTTFVESGQNAVSTDAGAISAPAATPADVKMTLDASYSYGVAQGEYAAPESSAADAKDGGTTVPGADDTPGTNTPTNGGGGIIPPDPVPITVANPPPAKPGVTIESVAFSGLVELVTNDGTNCILSSEPDNSVTGQFTFSRSVDSAWTTVPGEKGTVTGNVLCNTNIPSSYAFWISDEAKCTSASGGQYRGWLGASLSTSSSSASTTLWGKALFLYRDPSGRAGTMTFLFGGKYDPSNKSFYSELINSGNVEFQARELLQPGDPGYDLNSMSLTEGSIYGRGTGSFTAGGTIACGPGVPPPTDNTGLSGTTFDIDTDWGIWPVNAQGTYAGLTSDAWILALGGERQEVPVDPAHPSYWMGTINGNLWDDRDPGDASQTNMVKGGFKGIFFYVSGIGTFEGGSILNGNIVGRAEAPDWQVIGGGEFYVVYKGFTEAQLGFTAVELRDFVNVPISQVAASTNMAIAAPGAGFTTFTMDARVYDNGGAHLFIMEGPSQAHLRRALSLWPVGR